MVWLTAISADCVTSYFKASATSYNKKYIDILMQMQLERRRHKNNKITLWESSIKYPQNNNEIPSRDCWFVPACKQFFICKSSRDKENIQDKKQVERSTEERKKRERERTLAHRPTAALQLACNVPPLLCHSCGKHPSIRSSWGWANNRRKNFSFDALQRPRPVC